MPKIVESALFFRVGRSRCLSGLQNCLHALSMLACWLNDLSIIYKLILSVMVSISWFHQYAAYKTNAIYLRYTAAEGWAVSYDGEGYLAIHIKPTTVLGRTLAVLHFTTEKGGRSLVILKDAMVSSEFRRLIVKLKISGYSQGR